MRNLLAFGALSLILLACDALPQENDTLEVPGPGEVLLEINDGARFFSADKVADLIINDDPSLLLVDVRAHHQYDAFTLPGAVNIPLENILDEESRLQLDCQRYNIVLFSNSTVSAEQAWYLLRQRPCTNIYVLKGGLDSWVTTILEPAEPSAMATAQELEQYRFRQAASKYFAGEARVLEPEPYVKPVSVKAPPKKIEVKPKKKKVVEEEGC